MQTIKESVNPTEYRSYMGGYFKVLVTAEQSKECVSIIDITLPRGVEPPTHMHTIEDETFYIIEGQMRFHIGDQIIHGTKGESVFAPRQVPHHFEITTESARFLTIISPGNFLNYFLAFSSLTENPVIVPPQGPPPIELIEYMNKQLLEKYQVLFI